MSAILQDLRFALRALAKTPGLTFIVILSLALGIGANTSLFTLVNALLLRSLPVEHPEELVLYSKGNSRGFVSGQDGVWRIFPYPLARDFRKQQNSFQDVAAFRTLLDRLNVRQAGTEEAGQVAWGRLVSGSYFHVLGVKPAVGRLLVDEDERLEAAPAVVLSHEYWRRRFGQSAGIVGQVLNINGVMATVVGVAPAEFFGESVENALADAWMPLTLQPRIMPTQSQLESREVHWVNLIARLKPGVTRAQAQADVNVVLQQFLAANAGAKPSEEDRTYMSRQRVELVDGAGGVSALRSYYSRPLHILLGVVAFVLLIACANVANLLLSRAVAREKEISMRLALGASRQRLLRQMFTESLLLAGLGALAGVLLSVWMVNALVAAVSTAERTAPLNVSPDWRVLGFTLGVSLLTGLLFGVAPAFRALRVDVWPVLKGHSSEGGRSRWSLSRTFVVAQVALSLPLLVGAALFLQTLRQLRTQDFGFQEEHVLEVGIDPSIAGYGPEKLDPLYRNLLARVQAIGGVKAASLSLYSPMSGNNWNGPVEVEGYTPPKPDRPANSQWVFTGPRYAETVGLTLVAGRDLGEQDTRSSAKVTLINEAFVRSYFEGRNALGRSVSFAGQSMQVVGIVKDAKFNDPRQEMKPGMFLPLVQAPIRPAQYAEYLEVRVAGAPAAAAAAIRQAVRQVDPTLPVTRIRTLKEQVDAALQREKLIAGLSTFFAGLAVLLACIGLYGVLAYAVSRRSREIGIRAALGARQADIVSMVLREALLLAALGTACGLVASVALADGVSSLIYGLKPTDARTLAGAAAVLLLIGSMAGWLPARRAARVDPMSTLRAD